MAYDPIIYGGSKSSVKGYSSARAKYFEELKKEQEKAAKDQIAFGSGDSRTNAVEKSKSLWDRTKDVAGAAGNFVKDAAVAVKDDAQQSFRGIRDTIEGTVASGNELKLQQGKNDISNKYNKEIIDIYAKYDNSPNGVNDISAEDQKRIDELRAKKDTEVSDYKKRTNFDEASAEHTREFDEGQAVDAKKTAGAAASTFLNVATLGAGTAVKAGGKQAITQAVKAGTKQAAKEIAKRGAIAGAEGATFGAASGAASAMARDEDILKGAVQGAAFGGLVSGGLGVATGAGMARNAQKGVNAANKAGKEVTDELTKLGASDEELKAVTSAMDAEDAARAADTAKKAELDADKALQAKEWEQQYADIQANRAAGLNDDGSRFIDANATKKQIEDMQNGNYSDDLYDITTQDGKPVDPQFIQDATEKQVNILTAKRDELAAQIDAIESPAAREMGMANVNKLDDQIAALKSGDTTALLETSGTGLAKTLNTDRVRERFSQLQGDIAESNFRQRAEMAAAEKRNAPARTFDSVSSDMDALGAGGVAPEAVTPRADFVDVDEIVRHPSMPDPIRRRAMALSRDKTMLDEQLSQVMTPEKANTVLDEMDAKFNDDMARIETMPEPRRTVEAERVQSEYNNAYEEIQNQLAQDREVVGELTRVQEQIQANLDETLADANMLKDENPGVFGRVDQELNQKISQEIEQETETAIFNRMSNEEGVPDSQNVSKAFAEMPVEKIDDNIQTQEMGDLTTEALNDTFTNDGVKIYGDNLKALDSTYTGLSMSSNSHNLEKIFGKTGVELFGKIVKGYAHVSKANEQVAKTLTQVKKAFGGDKALYSKAVDVLEGKQVDMADFTPAQVEAIDKLKGLYEYGARQVRKLSYNEVVHTFEKRHAAGNIKYTVDEIKTLAKRDGMTIKEATAKYGDITDFKKSDINYLATQRAENSTLDNYYPHMFDGNGKELAFMDNEYMTSNGNVKFGNMLHRLTDSEDYSRDIIDVSARYFSALNKKTYLEPSLRELDNAKLAIKAADSDANAAWQWIDKYQGQLKYNKSDNIGKAWNEMIDKTISLKNPNSPKIGQNHYRSLLSTQRQINALAALGLSFRNAIQQTTQIGTAIGNLGTKDVASGMVKYLKQSLNPTTHKNYMNILDERGITHAGIAREAYSELLTDGVMGVTKSRGAKLSDTLMIMTQKMDEFARGSTYEASKLANLRKGMSNEAAEAVAAAEAAKFNFMTSKVDMPIALNGDTVRSLSQFMTFSYKQAEAWKDLGIKSIKNPETGQYQLRPKEMSKLLQMVAFYGVAFSGMSQVAGIEPEDNIPFYGNIFGDSGLPKSPIVSTLFGRNESSPGLLEIISGLATPEGDSEFDKQENRQKSFEDLSDLMVRSFVPAGSQIKKSVEGYQSTQNDGVVSKDGKVKFIQNASPTDMLRNPVLFGQYATDEGKEWINKKFPTLSEKQSEITQAQKDKESKQRAYDFYSGLKSATTKNTVTPKIKETMATQPNKAERLIREHNDKVSQAIQEYTSKYGELSEYERDYLMENYFITNGTLENISEEN